MAFQIDMQVAELLASRLCHDLVGPIGAVNNGMELLEDEDLGMSEDAIQLSASSARQAANLLPILPPGLWHGRGAYRRRLWCLAGIGRRLSGFEQDHIGLDGRAAGRRHARGAGANCCST